MKNILSIIVSALILFACSSSASKHTTSAYAAQARELRQNGESDRVVLKSASITIAVKEPDSILQTVENIAKKYGGYIAGSRLEYANIKVKAEYLEEALKTVGTLGSVKSQSINTQDVTQEYTDYKIRLENATKARNRYQELLKKAQTVEEILPIEKELQRVTENIERLRAAIEAVEHQQALSSIQVYWHKRVKPGPIGYVFVGLYKAVKVLFVRGG